MSAQCEVTAKKPRASAISFFERYLTLWVFLCIVAGIALGYWFPSPFRYWATWRSRRSSLPVSYSDLVDDYSDVAEDRFWRPASCQGALARCRRHAVRQLGGKTLFNGTARLDLYTDVVLDWLPADQINSYIAGLILLAAAPCTAMVFVFELMSPVGSHTLL